jgi:type IV pilus assembly protein PilN
MIRINLLAVERKPERKSILAGQKVAILGTAILAAAALFVGWRFFSLRQETARLDEDLRAAQQEQQRLRSILQQVTDFEQRKQQLQQRVALIEELRKGQGAPVRMLDEISRALPDRLWLTELAQDATGVRIDGRTTSLTSLSDFVGNLEGSGYFARPVEILDSQVEGSQADIVKFSVKAQFQLPGAKAATPEAPPAPGAQGAVAPAAKPPATPPATAPGGRAAGR